MATGTSEHGHSVHDPKQPLEVLRTIHSFDLYLVCAVYLTDEEGESFEVRVV